MKKRIVLLTTFVTLLLFAAITGCKRGDDNYYYYGNVTFWNDDNTLSDIIVTVDNNQTGRISTFRSPSFCNEADFANFYLIEGNHYYSARTVNGTYLGQYNFYVSGNCTFVYIP